MSRIDYLIERYEQHRMRNSMTRNHSSNIFNLLSKSAMYTFCQNSRRQTASYYSEQRKINLLNTHRVSQRWRMLLQFVTCNTHVYVKVFAYPAFSSFSSFLFLAINFVF